MKKVVLAILTLAFTTTLLFGQEDILFTRSFTKKLKRVGIEFYLPAEDWLKASNKTRDEFMKYDIVLHSESQYEIRFVIKKDEKSHDQHPHIETVRLLTSIATNDESHLIEIESLGSEILENEYGADWGIVAHFRPKEQFSNFKNGRLLSLYKSGRALASCIILYDLPLSAYHEKPFRFN